MRRGHIIVDQNIKGRKYDMIFHDLLSTVRTGRERQGCMVVMRAEGAHYTRQHRFL